MTERLKVHVLKTCLAKANVGSNPTPSARRFTILDLRLPIENRQHLHLRQVQVSAIVNPLGRCQSGRMGPPAKRLPGRNPRSQVRILSSPPLRNAFHMERVFVLYAQSERLQSLKSHPKSGDFGLHHRLRLIFMPK